MAICITPSIFKAGKTDKLNMRRGKIRHYLSVSFNVYLNHEGLDPDVIYLSFLVRTLE